MYENRHRDPKEGDSPCTVRPAAPEDAGIAARLMYMSGPETALAMFGPGEAQALDVLAFLFRGRRHQFSHEHAVVAERAGCVVALALGMSGAQWASVGEATGRELGGELRERLGLIRFLRLLRTTLVLSRSFPSPRPDDYFVQMIAVLPEARRRGIGRRLMACMEARARESGAKRLTLDVLIENEDARAFYRALGLTEELTVRSRALARRFGVQGRIRMSGPIPLLTNQKEGQSPSTQQGEDPL